MKQAGYYYNMISDENPIKIDQISQFFGSNETRWNQT